MYFRAGGRDRQEWHDVGLCVHYGEQPISLVIRAVPPRAPEHSVVGSWRWSCSTRPRITVQWRRTPRAALDPLTRPMHSSTPIMPTARSPQPSAPSEGSHDRGASARPDHARKSAHRPTGTSTPARPGDRSRGLGGGPVYPPRGTRRWLSVGQLSQSRSPLLRARTSGAPLPHLKLGARAQ
jgi:hypothetical protein